MGRRAMTGRWPVPGDVIVRIVLAQPALLTLWRLIACFVS